MHPNLILFDGVCNFCNFWVNFIIDRDSKAFFKFTALQSDTARQILKSNNIDAIKIDSIVLVINGKIFFKSSAAFQIARKLDGFWKLLYIFIIIPPFMRDRIYDFIASNRYKWFGKRETCRIPTDNEKHRFIH